MTEGSGLASIAGNTGRQTYGHTRTNAEGCKIRAEERMLPARVWWPRACHDDPVIWAWTGQAQRKRRKGAKTNPHRIRHTVQVTVHEIAVVVVMLWFGGKQVRRAVKSWTLRRLRQGAQKKTRISTHLDASATTSLIMLVILLNDAVRDLHGLYQACPTCPTCQRTHQLVIHTHHYSDKTKLSTRQRK